MKLLVLVILGFACLLSGKKIHEDKAEQPSEKGHGTESFENNADLIDQETEAELDPVEDGADIGAIDKKQEAGLVGVVIKGAVKAIKYYCRFCKVAKNCRKVSKSCTSSVLKNAQKLCKYCDPKTYAKLISSRRRSTSRRRRSSRRRRRRRRANHASDHAQGRFIRILALYLFVLFIVS